MGWELPDVSHGLVLCTVLSCFKVGVALIVLEVGKTVLISRQWTSLSVELGFYSKMATLRMAS